MNNKPETISTPNWSAYVTGGLLSEKEAGILQYLDWDKAINNMEGIQEIQDVLDRQVSQEVTAYIVYVMKKSVLWKMNPEDGNRFLNILSKIVRKSETGSGRADALWIMSRIVMENSQVIDKRPFFDLCTEILHSLSPEHCIEILDSLALTLQKPPVAQAFSYCRDLQVALMEVLSMISNQPQLHYNALLCLWLVSFESSSMDRILHKANFIPLTIVICRSTAKEKVIRVGAGLWRNLLKNHKVTVLPILIGAKAPEFISLCIKKEYSDPDLNEDLHMIDGELQSALLKLSTFDEYASEVKSGILDWSPPHKSALFWKDNATRLNENNAELLMYHSCLLIIQDACLIAYSDLIQKL